jgi:hypothetical protein
MVAAVVDATSLLVVNLIMANAQEDPPYQGTFLVDVAEQNCGIGWAYDPILRVFVEPGPLA